MVEMISNINSAINGFVWGIPCLTLLVSTGVIMTVLTKCFQVRHIGHWIKATIGASFKKSSGVNDKSDKHAISQFQSMCTALAATIGVGNIAGVATAIASGGPGAIFWMWVAAFFGMMTCYSENVLGIYYRRKNVEGEWCGGAMYYLKDGLGSYKGCKQLGKMLAVLFAIFCIMASFGIGNASQINTIATNMKNVFNIPTLVTGIVLMLIAGLVIVGGIKRMASVTEKMVPFMAIAYIVGALIVFFVNIDRQVQYSSLFSALHLASRQ